MKWTKLKVHVAPEAVDAVADSILGLGIEGIEIEDNFLSEEDRKAMFIDYTDEDLIPLEEYRIVAYLDESQDVAKVQGMIEAELTRIRNFIPVGSGRFSIEVMPEDDYENKWKEFYKPFRVGDHMIVTPLWEAPEATPEDIVIRIDPGMAFGSGTHETTAMCVEFLQEIDVRAKKVVDVGCGSGILGIVAAKLEAAEVLAIDIDENAVTVAAQNAVTNEVAAQMTVTQGDLLDKVRDKTQVVVANILADVILHITPQVKEVLEEGGYFISSGILATRAEEVAEGLRTGGYEVVEIRTRGEWSAILARRQ